MTHRRPRLTRSPKATKLRTSIVMRRHVSSPFHKLTAISSLWLLAAAYSIAAPFSASQSLAGLKLPPGFKAEIYAGPEHVSNPVAICFDTQGRLYTAEAHRRVTGAWGVTMSRWWSMEDYAGKTLADRQAMYDRWAHIVPPAKLTRHSDIVRQLIDTDGDGRVDVSNIFADGFNQPLEGNAAGIIERDGDIFLANVPHLWRLRDSNRDGVADTREKLVRGLGVRVGVYGHDLHGLTWGPDGRLYFSIGDRGFDVKTKEGKKISAPTRGGVFRCFPDGSGLELFHIGLRNPQEIAFNDVGDLFTVDNDMGGVDKCRVIHIIEGGDSGWDATYQLTRNFREETQRHDHTEPPWFTEKLWELPHEGQPAWVNPPIAHLTSGPSGLAHYPGVGLPESYNDSFFICDFRGTSTRSGVYQFKLAQDGASYRMTETNQFVWNILPADIEFGYDGRIYLADWINGWGGEGDRRIVRVFHPIQAMTLSVQTIDVVIKSDFADFTTDQLAVILNHPDQRLRQRSQFELARRGQKNFRLFLQAARNESILRPRLHGIWGLWQMGLQRDLPRTAQKGLIKLLDDKDAEIRAQAAKVIGELGLKNAAPDLVRLLRDPNLRARYHATIALGKLKYTNSISPIAAMLRKKDNQDFNLRHAVAFAFSRFAKASVVKLASDEASTVRLAVLQSFRQNASPEIGIFLDDPDPQLRFEAIRAIHDLPIPDCLGDLADLIDSPIMSDAIVPFPIKHRILNANFRLGSAKGADRVAMTTANAELAHDVRIEALRSLEKWQEPSPFDRVTWHHRPLKRRGRAKMESTVLAAASKSFRTDLDLPESANRKEATARMLVAGRLLADHNALDAATVESWLTSPQIDASIRLAMIERYRANGKRIHQSLGVAEALLKDKAAEARIEGAIQLAAFDGKRASTTLQAFLTGKTLKPRQLAIGRLGAFDNPISANLLTQFFNARTNKEAGPDTLDLYLAAKAHKNARLNNEAKKLLTSMQTGDPHGEFQMTLAGGDAKRGKRIFETHAIQCVRCHTIKGFGGDAGPELTKIGKELDRTGILTALIDPPARIAPGFGTFEFELQDGETLSGFVAKETESEIELTNLQGETVRVKKSTIQSRSNPASAMPTMKGVLTLSEIRDLVEYLSGLK